ncbi:MAG TPA: WD40 repeat domain-containing protein, partial [Anaerolineae bacterium]
NQIAEDAAEWEKNRRDASYRYVGARLANAREQLAAKKIVLNGLARAFVTTSVEAEETNRQREAARIQKELDDARKLAESEKKRAEDQAQAAAKLRRGSVYLIGALGVALLLGMAASIFGVQSTDLAAQNASIARTAQAAEANALTQRDEAQRQARISLSRQLAAQSLARRDEQIDLALLLAVEAWRTEPTAEARNSLFSAIQHSPGLMTIIYAGGQIRQLAVSADGLLLALIECGLDPNGPDYCTQGEVRLWDISDLHQPRPLGKLPEPPNQLDAIAFSPVRNAPRLLVVAGYGANMLSLWDTSQADAPVRLSVFFTSTQSTASVYISDITFNPDGTRLAAIEQFSSNTNLSLWDITQPHAPSLLTSPEITNSQLSRLAFTPDGKRLLGASANGSISLWNVVNGRSIEFSGSAASTNFNPNSGLIGNIAAAPNGQYLAIGATDGSVALWNISGTLTTPVSIDLLELPGAVASAAIDP